MLIDIVVIIFTTIAIPVIAWYVYYYNWIYRTGGLKGPTPLPILGNALEFKGKTKTVLADISRLIGKYGKVYPLMIGIEAFIVVADYDVFEKILSSTQIVDKSPFYRFFHNWLNSGLLISSGAKWKKRRRILTPTYHFRILEQFIPVFEQVANILVDQIRQDNHLDAIDIYPYITLSTLDAICNTAMGVTINAQLDKHSDYVTSVKAMGKIIIERSVRPLEQSSWTYWLTENYQIEKRCLKIIHNHTKSVIAKRRQELEKIKIDTEDKDDIGIKKRVAFLDLLLKTTDNGVPLTDEDIQEEVNTFMFEGHDTTASAISFALYLIANHSDVQDKVVVEQEKIFGGDFRDVTYNDLNQMQYLEMVIKETLRLYPSVPFYGRYHSEDIKIGKGITIPANTAISLIAYEIQRDPEFFPNPDKFDPDRFLPENYLGKKPYCFIPFSAGPRNCIGQRFAILEMKSIISKIVRSFQLSPSVPVHTLELTGETILKSGNGIIIKIEERKSQNY